MPHPSENIVEIYDRLHEKHISRNDKLCRARAYLEDPTPLARAFAESAMGIERYEPADEGFYTSRAHAEVADVHKAGAKFALRVRDAGGLTPTPKSGPALEGESVAGGVVRVEAGALGCGYLNRELQVIRTTGRRPKPTGTAMQLDLLLVNHDDRTPICAELKVTDDSKPTGTDKDPFSALIQALALVSQFASPAQYTRLRRYGAAAPSGRDIPGQADIAETTPPVFDVYVILHNRPGGTDQDTLLEVTKDLAVQLLNTDAVARHVRRIACLITSQTSHGDLAAEVEWAYQGPGASTARVESMFADLFRHWGIVLPAAAVLLRADGELRAEGWAIRWRWRGGAIEYRAVHRMTNERWSVIEPDGTLMRKGTPSEMMIRRPDEDLAEVEATYRARWQAHSEALAGAGMDFHDLPPQTPADPRRASNELAS